MNSDLINTQASTFALFIASALSNDVTLTLTQDEKDSLFRQFKAACGVLPFKNFVTNSGGWSGERDWRKAALDALSPVVRGWGILWRAYEEPLINCSYGAQRATALIFPTSKDGKNTMPHLAFLIERLENLRENAKV